MRQDYAEFYRQEVVFRKELRYPPFSRFVNFICADEQEPKAKARAETLAAALERVLPPEVEIIGPSPAPLARLKNQFRYHLALRAPEEMILSQKIRETLANLSVNDRMGITVDIDPLSMA
jgi:primosomal protein N' (replication factor Y)